MIKSELIPKGSKLDSLSRGSGSGTREYHYEYKEEKHPSGKYDRKDLHTVEVSFVKTAAALGIFRGGLYKHR